MAKKLRVQRKAGARRKPRPGSGKPEASVPERGAPGRRAETDVGELRRRLTREREAAIERLQALLVSSEFGENAPPRGNESSLEEGDAAQASTSRDMSFTTRERLARRINQLAAALERMARGEYGRCSVCGQAIEPERLAAIPEADTCLACQSARERGAA
jgi:RNA polymerase-binding transcription factor DksA